MNDDVMQSVRKAIADNVFPGELKSEPVLDTETNEWSALVALAPSGPLVRMSFRLTLSSALFDHNV